MDITKVSYILVDPAPRLDVQGLALAQPERELGTMTRHRLCHPDGQDTRVAFFFFFFFLLQKFT